MRIYDVKTAFLHGKLKEGIFMEIPDGIQINKERVCKLRKSLYGLKQAGKCWNEYLTRVMRKCRLNQSKEDSCLFFVREKNRFLYCGVYVDDMPAVSSDDEFEKRYMKKLIQYIDIKELGEAKTVFGMQLIQDEGKLYIHQKEYILKNCLKCMG